jgi:hypothetical protein
VALPIQRGSRPLPNRVLYYGSPGSCKTTFGAFAPKPLFLLTPGETGLITLNNYGRAPDCDYIEVRTWAEVLRYVLEIARDQGEHKTLVIDTVNGLESLCFKHVTDTTYNGESKSFYDYGKGPESAVSEWMKIFPMLDSLRTARNMAIVLLAHAGEKKIKTSSGADYLKTVPLIHEKLRNGLIQWCDIILFARRTLTTKKEGLTVKASTLGDLELLATEGGDHEAKNRVGIPGEIMVPDENPASVFGAFAAAMRVAREQGKKPEPKQEAKQPEPKAEAVAA